MNLRIAQGDVMQNNKLKLEKILFNSIDGCYNTKTSSNLYCNIVKRRDPTVEKNPTDENGKYVLYFS